ncbi:MAG: SpoIIE family protein phosphatase [Armatimonadetes bacterium]|nr:SpoIIE family protein phosphatase [Armatimonadota bacterium]
MTTGVDGNEAKPRSNPTGILDLRYVRLAVASLVVIAVADSLNRHNIVFPAAYYGGIHMLLELTSIVVSFAVFTMAWYGHRQTRNARDLLIGITFFITALIDLIHTLSYQGMPAVFGASDPGKAAAYWIFARLIVALGLLVASRMAPDIKSKWLSPGLLVFAALATVGALVTMITMGHPLSGRMFYDPINRGPTALKNGLEYLTIALYAAVFLTLSRRRGWERQTIDVLRSAMLMAVFAELAFTLYRSPFGLFNALGHVFKTAAYFLILKALFVSAIQRPYDELSMAREDLQEMYLDVREHRAEIERSFAHIGNALSSSLRIEEALDQIADLVGDMLHANCSMVATLGKNGEVVHVAAEKGGCSLARRPLNLTLELGREALSGRRTVVVDDIEKAKLIECEFREAHCLRSIMCAPMVLNGQALGVIAVYSHTAYAFEQHDITLLEGFASHAAVAVHNAMSYERESRIADVLQRSLLESAKLETGRFEIAQVYEPAMNEALVGGDFYDVIEMADGKIGLVIGDVSGKGLAAAVHTALVKYTLRAYVNEGHSPARALCLLDAILCKSSNMEYFVTMFFGVLDTQTGVLIYANAGHELPICISNGALLTLPVTGPALGIGIGLDQGFEEGSILLDDDSTLLLYTDGISEARNGDTFMGTERIGEQLLICKEQGAQDVAKCIHGAAIEFAGGELKDDAAILAVRTLASVTTGAKTGSAKQHGQTGIIE